MSLHRSDFFLRRFIRKVPLFHWSFALYGAVICIIAAFLIDPPATLGAVALLTLIYLYVRKFVLTSSFGDARRGFVYSRIRDNLFALAQLPLHPKNWRPTSLVLAGDAGERLTLVHYAVWMGSGRGIVLLVSILQGEFTEMLNERKKVLEGLGEFIEKNNLKAFPQVLVDNVFDHGLQSLLQSSSVGPLHPNMVVMGFPKDLSRAHMFVHHLNTAQSLGMSQILVYDAGVPVFKGRKKKLIDIWWRGMENGSLMLILAYLVSLNQEWTNTVLRIVRVISSNAEEPEDRGEMKRLVDSARIPAEILLVEGGGKPFNEILDAHSRHSTAIFLGFRIPAQSDAGSFLEYFAKVLRGLPTTIIVHSTGEADLTS